MRMYIDFEKLDDLADPMRESYLRAMKEFEKFQDHRSAQRMHEAVKAIDRLMDSIREMFEKADMPDE